MQEESNNFAKSPHDLKLEKTKLSKKQRRLLNKMANDKLSKTAIKKKYKSDSKFVHEQKRSVNHRKRKLEENPSLSREDILNLSQGPRNSPPPRVTSKAIQEVRQLYSTAFTLASFFKDAIQVIDEEEIPLENPREVIEIFDDEVEEEKEEIRECNPANKTPSTA